MLHKSDVMQLYSNEFLSIEGNTDLNDDIEGMLRSTLDKEPPAPGTAVPIHTLVDVAFHP
jgi:hypothetical protein